MALPKKGSSLIRVEGAEYRWRVSRTPAHERTCSECPSARSVIVQLARGKGQRLVVHTPYGGKSPRPDDPAITPSLVQHIILAASRLGWEPQKSGQEIVFSMDAAQKLTRWPPS